MFTSRWVELPPRTRNRPAVDVRRADLKHNYHVVETVPNVPVLFEVLHVKMSFYSFYSQSSVYYSSV